MSRRTFLWTGNIVLMTLLLWLLLRSIEPAGIVRLLRSFPAGWLAAAFGFHMAAYLFRTLRYRVALTGPAVPFGTLMCIHTVHNLYNHLLPAGLGEASFPLMLGRYGGYKLSVGSASVLLVRICDVAVLLLLLAAGIPLAHMPYRAEMAPWLTPVAVLSGVGAVLLLVLAVILPVRTAAFFEAGRFAGTALVRFGASLLRSMAAAAGRGALPGILGLSLLSNASIVGCFWAILHGLQLPVGPVGTAVGTAILIPMYLLPVRGIAGLGTVEGGWALALWILGRETAEGIYAGFAIHIITFSFVLLLAAAGGAYLAFGRRSSTAVPGAEIPHG